MKADEHDRKNFPHQPEEAWHVWFAQQVNSLKYGTVQITVHDSRVTQGERIEKIRFESGKE
jgi:hypothetical protein